MDSKCKVSVIMGVFNCINTIHESIQSLIKQTFTSWELLICDDGSSDGTTEYVRRLEIPGHDVVAIYNEKNIGLSKTLNKCLQFAKSEYIARMDGDDISHPKRLEIETKFLDEHPEYGFVSCAMLYFDETGVWGSKQQSPVPSIHDLVRASPYAHAPSLLRKSVMDEAENYSEDDKYTRIEDYHLWFKLHAKGIQGYNLEDYLYLVRENMASMKRKKLSHRINEFKLKIEIIKFFSLAPKWYIQAMKPIILGLLPKPVYAYLHRRSIRKLILKDNQNDQNTSCSS